MNTRRLTVEEDFGRTGAKLRLKGKWLKRAGFNPGAKVTLNLASPGVIEMRVCSPVQLSADCLRVMGRLDAAMAAA